jgi:hypothetical protein
MGREREGGEEQVLGVDHGCPDDGELELLE